MKLKIDRLEGDVALHEQQLSYGHQNTSLIRGF